MTPAAARRSAAGTAPRRQQTRKVAAHWYPAIAAVERDTACAEMERLARGVAPSRAWEECEPLAPTPLGVAVGGRAAVGVERLLQVLEEKKGLQRVEQLANLLEGSAKEAAIPVDARGFNGQTTMAVAATSGNADVMQLLLRYGADVNIANSRGWTPLMLACQRNREASLAVLLGARALADVALLNRDGDSALTIALAAGHTEVCTKLVRAGATLPTMLGPGSATDARDRALDLARKGLHLTALSGATDVVRQCLRVIETRDWDRNKPPAMSAKPAEEQAMAGLGVDADEAMLFARTGERVNKYLWPGHRLAKGMERRREELRERGIELLWEAEGKKRRLSKGTVVLLAPGQENTGNGALRGDETGTVIKVTPEEDRVRVKGPSGRHCWYAIDELLSWQEKKAVEQDSDEAEDEADPGLPDFAGDGDGRGGDSSPVWGISELIHKHESATSGFQASEDERHYLQEMRRQEATRHQKELWQKQKERRVHKKGTAAQALLTEAFAEAGGKTPQGSELQDLVAATRVREEEVVEWFSYTRKQAKARQAGLRWGNAGGTLMGAGSEDDLLRRVDEAEEEVRKKKHPKMKAQEDREEAHENWVEKWGGEAPSSKERKRLGEKRIGEPLLVDPNEEVEDEAEAAQRAWEDKMMADKNTPAQALVARRKRQQELDGLGQQLTGDGGGMVRLSGGMLNQRNAVTAADIGGGGGVPGGSGASSLDSLTQALRVARSYDNSMFQHKLTAQLGEANSKSSAKMMRTAQKVRNMMNCCLSKTRNFVSKTRNCVFITMNFAGPIKAGRSRQGPVAVRAQ